MSKDDDLLETARKRFALSVDADKDNRQEALDDLQNLTGWQQWPVELRKEREDDGRPCLTVNQLPQFLRQVTGDLRQMNPAIDVTPADSAATPDGAELFAGIIRHIEYRSDASSVYEGAAESAAACGMGYFRILSEYEDDASFNQDIRIQRLPNPFGVYCDPEAREPTRSDAQYWFITQTMKQEDFKRQYPKATAADVKVDGNTDDQMVWRSGDDIVVAEYFYLEPKQARLVLLKDGTTEIDPPANRKDIVQERKTTIHKPMWAKISGTDILEGPKPLPGKYLPIVAVLGEELYAGTKYYRSSVIRHAKDPQRLYNYWWSAQTEVVALQPKAPFLITAKQIEGREKQWNSANKSNRPYLVFNPDPAYPAAPQRSQPPLSSSGMMDMMVLAGQDMRSTTGIYDASLGQKSNENSGVAIRQRQQEGDVSTSIYADNMGKAIRRCGEIILHMIPEVFDTARVLRIVGKEGKQEMVPVNVPKPTMDGPTVFNDLTKGKYDVQVKVGPNYSTKRQEAAESMMQFVQAVPAAGAVTADLIAKNMDWPGADQFSDRLKKILPPGVAEPSDDPKEQQAATLQKQNAEKEQQKQTDFQTLMMQMEGRIKIANAREADANADEAEAKVKLAQLQLQKAMTQPMDGSAQPGQPA